jgi:hypothetical protein
MYPGASEATHKTNEKRNGSSEWNIHASAANQISGLRSTAQQHLLPDPDHALPIHLRLHREGSHQVIGSVARTMGTSTNEHSIIHPVLKVNANLGFVAWSFSGASQKSATRHLSSGGTSHGCTTASSEER